MIDYDAQSEAKGDKNLWTEREYGDFVLQLDWRIKEAPFINKNIPYILPDGTHARDIHGKEMKLALPDADSGVFLRGDGHLPGQHLVLADRLGRGVQRPDRPQDVRPRSAPPSRPGTQADKPVGEWNHFEITVKGKTVEVVLNGKTVIPGADDPRHPRPRAASRFQHHGGKNRTANGPGPPSLVQFKNIYIKELK